MKFKKYVKIIDILNSEIYSGFTNNCEDLKIEEKKNILKVQNEICKAYNLRQKSLTSLKLMMLIPLNADIKFLKLKRKYLVLYKVINVKINVTSDVQNSGLPKIRLSQTLVQST